MRNDILTYTGKEEEFGDLSTSAKLLSISHRMSFCTLFCHIGLRERDRNCKTRLPGFAELGEDADAATTLNDFPALLLLQLRWWQSRIADGNARNDLPWPFAQPLHDPPPLLTRRTGDKVKIIELGAADNNEDAAME